MLTFEQGHLGKFNYSEFWITVYVDVFHVFALFRAVLNLKKNAIFINTLFVFVISADPVSEYKSLSLSHQGCIYFVRNTVKTIILWNIITI